MANANGPVTPEHMLALAAAILKEEVLIDLAHQELAPPSPSQEAPSVEELDPAPAA